MKVHPAFSFGALICRNRRFALPVLAVLLLVGKTNDAIAAANPASPAPAATSTNQVTAPLEIPQSIFVIPNNPREGRNPFFPGSHAELPPTPKPPVQVDSSSFVLNGITSPPKRTAMINGRTFELGEEGKVRVPSGGMEMIKCVEIGADSATIEWKGQQLQLRFRSSP